MLKQIKTQNRMAALRAAILFWVLILGKTDNVIVMLSSKLVLWGFAPAAQKTPQLDQ
jgi:hypothetical protein